MSTPVDPRGALLVGDEAPSYLTAERGLWSWLTTTDHKRIGLMYLMATTGSLMLGGLFAMLLRLELLTPEHTYIGAETYNRFFTAHGVIMVWMFMIPAIPAGFGNFLIPLMIGARDVAFPRLNLTSFYFYLAGSAIVLYGLVAGGVDTGWTFYVPYSVHSLSQVAVVAIGIFTLGISTIMTGVNLIATIHTLRGRGMQWRKLPIFVWTIYATAIMQSLATPVLGITLLLVAVDKLWSFGIFDPNLGGDPILYQHLFWFYSHPAVYIMILPSMGVAAEIVSAFSRKNPYTYRGLVVSSLGIAFVGFLAWGHHMFTSGMSTTDAAAFGILSMWVAIFSAIKMFSWVGTMYKGSISLKTPMIYFLEFLFLFGVGGTTGVALASTSLDIHWQDTYFVVAHFHFIMVGATMTAFLAAVHYWWPKLFGRLYNETLGVLASSMIFLGFLTTFIPQFLLGNAGMPRRMYEYPPEFQTLHDISTVGSWAIGGGILLVGAYLTYSLFYGARSGDNPWRSRGFEWMTPSPPPPHNFEVTPDYRARNVHDYWAEEVG